MPTPREIAATVPGDKKWLAVPDGPAEDRRVDRHGDSPRLGREPAVPHAPHKNRRPSRYSWPELLRRAFLIDVLTLPKCRGPRTPLAAISDPDSIHRIVAHLGFPTERPEIAPVRPTPV